MPSVSSLKALRVLVPEDITSTYPFIGFGDPLLGDDIGDRRGFKLGAKNNNERGVDISNIHQLPALPETAGELKEIATSLGVGKEQIYLRERATEAQVKSLDLSKTNVIAFATHGLIAGELRGSREPALVLTPPDTVNDDDNGVLTASEIAQLNLYPGLVILVRAIPPHPMARLVLKGYPD